MSKDDKDGKGGKEPTGELQATQVTSGANLAPGAPSSPQQPPPQPSGVRSAPGGPDPGHPLLFETSSGVIVIADVSSVQCYQTAAGAGSCEVTLRSGVKVGIDLQYSRALIEAVKDHYSDGSSVFVATARGTAPPARPRGP